MSEGNGKPGGNLLNGKLGVKETVIAIFFIGGFIYSGTAKWTSQQDSLDVLTTHVATLTQDVSELTKAVTTLSINNADMARTITEGKRARDIQIDGIKTAITDLGSRVDDQARQLDDAHKDSGNKFAYLSDQLVNIVKDLSVLKCRVVPNKCGVQQ